MYSNTETMYWLLMQEVISMPYWRWEPMYCIVDFETASIAAIRAQLPKSELVGCFLIINRLVTKKMKKLGIKKGLADSAVSEFDFLATIEVDRITTGLAYLQDVVSNGNEQFVKFFEYFERL